MAKSKMVPVFDGHNDTLLHLTMTRPGSEETFFSGAEGHLDLPRARAGGLAGGFFAMFTRTPGWKWEVSWRKTGPQGPDEVGGWDVPMAGPVHQQKAINSVLAMMGTLFRLERMSEGEVEVVRTVKELRSAMDRGVLAAVAHMEGAEALTKDLNGLEVLYQAGLRSLGIVWSRPNVFGHGVPFTFPDSPDIGPGLTPAGKDLVRACNDMGILVDVSHLNEKGFWDVASLSKAPLVATHSAAHTLCASPRNLTDDQLKAIGESGGIVGVNFARGFVRKDGLEAKRTTAREIAKHVVYIAEKIGVDHVGLGSDFDGTVVPQDMKDVAGLPKLLDALRDLGVKGKDLKKVAHRNWIRVLKATWNQVP
jgi:membrane dipeptidase